MPGDELKSAYERALEKLKEKGIDETIEKLSSEQKAEIAQIRSLYKSKIAELEIRKQGDSTKAQTIEELEKIQERFVSERLRLEQEMERKISEVRQRS
jgi:cell division septum initiation protein DivIVA